MNNPCLSENKISLILGAVLLSLSFIIAIIGSFLLPIVALLISFPLLLGGLNLMTANDSEACRLASNS